MSPIIDLQRRVVEVGRIRAGHRVNGRPAKGETWRFTSGDRRRLDELAQLHGGTVKQWDGHPGQYELQTNATTVPVMLVPGQNLTQWYELWSGGGCQRRCDGITDTISDGPCLCNPEARECHEHTRLSVMLPEVPGIGLWRIDTTGYNAARELAGTAELLEQITARGQLVPAWLRLEQCVSVRDGQTRRYVKPVLDIGVRVGELLGLTSGTPAVTQLEQPAYTPLPELERGVTVQDGLDAANRQATPKTRTARSAEPIGQVVDFTQPQPIPVPADLTFEGSPADGTPDAAAAAPGSAGEQAPPVTPSVGGEAAEAAPANLTPAGAAHPSDVKPATQPQLKKLNVLVGQARDHGIITTRQLVAAIGRHRGSDPEQMRLLALGDDGDLHWSPVRDTLTRSEATWLIDNMEALHAKHPQPKDAA